MDKRTKIKWHTSHSTCSWIHLGIMKQAVWACSAISPTSSLEPNDETHAPLYVICSDTMLLFLESTDYLLMPHKETGVTVN